ncbi:FMN phosphatase YigB (HAD superfamily) [Nakamurella sp. UYEF19]|uniref:HAD family hydrolase n=1 Tax=Nakamurella sp. UYEF19 TaxID=1756392 RepID=UPI003397AB1E
MPDPLALLIDFDGTLYEGDLPVLSYARHCAAHLDDAGATALIDGIRYFLEGKAIGTVAVDLSTAEDGCQAVEILAAAAGLSTDQVDEAYRRSRVDLAASAFALDAPEGLAALLGALTGVHVVVVTNADRIGVREVIDAIGLAELVDEVVTDAGKPDTLPRIVAAALDRIGASSDPTRLMAVGDRWLHDLAAAQLAGARTAMVDRFDRGVGEPDVRARTLAGLLPGITDWARQHGALASDSVPLRDRPSAPTSRSAPISREIR